jgi:hypothetical protein
MFKTLSRFTSSFAALLIDQNTELDADGRMEDVRSAMANQLSVIGNSMECTCILSGIARASDIQTLWYLRSDLVKVLADCHGEEIARENVGQITEMFVGLVPQQFLKNSGAGPRNRAR